MLEHIKVLYPVDLYSVIPTNSQTPEDTQNDGTEQKLDKYAEFPGGEMEMFKFLGMNVRYPEAAIKENRQGRSVVQFTVNADGSISDIKVVNPTYGDLDAEAIRVVESMPAWTPAQKDGKNVASTYDIPVAFKLTQNDGTEQKLDKYAEFPGGEMEMFKFLGMNVRYPEAAIKENRQGRSVVQFTVNADGSISDIKVVNPTYGDLDAEAIRVVESMPAWTPAQKDGKNVASTYDIPVAFKLQGEEK